MSSNTLVLYLKDPEIKEQLKIEAKSHGQSLSELVSNILEEHFKPQKPKNALMKYAGSLSDVPDDEWKEFTDSMEDFRRNFDSGLDNKPNLFD